MGSIENKEMLNVTEVKAQLNGDNQRDAYSNTHHSYRLQLGPTSSTPIDPSPFNMPITDLAPSSSVQPVKTNTDSIPVDSEKDDDIMTTTSINPGDLLHTLWVDATPSGTFHIFQNRDGADYDPTTVNLSNDVGANSGIEPAFAVSGNVVHVVWRDFLTDDILYSKSIDGGASFGPIINISNNVETSETPAIAISGNTVHVVWVDTQPGNFDIFYRRSTDGGASFTEPIKNLSSNLMDSRRPSIAVSGNNVHVVWDDNSLGNSEILYRRSLNGGDLFPNVIKNLSSNDGFSFEPAIAVSGNTVHVVWDDDTLPFTIDILYRRSLNNGDTFPNIIKNLSSNLGDSGQASIAVSGNNVHVVWEDNTDNTPANYDILYRKSLNNGDTFPNIIKNLSSNAHFSISPAIALSGNNVYTVWSQGTASGNTDILYRTSANNGDTFPAVGTNLSANIGASIQPAIAVS
jgi:hypothetical protein